MKKFKSLFLAAALVLGFAACSNEGDMPYVGGEASYVSISLVSATRAATGNVEGGSLLLTDREVHLAPGLDAVIFVLNGAGEVLHRQAVTGIATGAANATVLQYPAGHANAGQPRQFQLTSQIYVVANIPTANANAERDWLMNATLVPDLATINARAQAIGTQTVRANPVVANIGSTGVAISTGSTVNVGGQDYRLVNVNVSPVIARMELAGIQVNRNWHTHDASTAAAQALNPGVTIERRILGFNVTGVFLHGAFRNFTYGGSGTEALTITAAGTYVTNAELTAHLGGLGPHVPFIDDVVPTAPLNPTTWVATPGGTAVTVTPGYYEAVNNHVWAFNFPAGNVPRLVIRFDNIQYEYRVIAANGTVGAAIPGTSLGAGEPRFITVTHFNGSSDTARVRGNIYHIAATSFNINSNDLDLEGFEYENVYVRVQVTTIPWNLIMTVPGW